MTQPAPPRTPTTGRARGLVMLVPLALVALIYTCDALIARVPSGSAGSVVVTGLLDEPGHLATALLVLLALVPLRSLLAHRHESAVVLACAVLIDLDHVPLYAGLPVSVGGRPFTHSLGTVVVLAVVALAMPPGRRRWPALVAAGVVLHFVRDVATGPGLALWWPLRWDVVLLPYGVYATVVAVLGVIGCVRLCPLRPATPPDVAAISSSGAAPRPR